MINSIQRDQRRRILVLKFAVKRVQYKALSQNGLFSSQLEAKLLLPKGGAKKTPFLGSKKQVSLSKTISGKQNERTKYSNTKNKDANNSQTDTRLFGSSVFFARYQRENSPKIPRNASVTRVRNRCILTARSRGVLRFCKLSRIRLRKLACQGLLSGVSKASW